MGTERVEAPLSALIGATVTAVELIAPGNGSAVIRFNTGADLYVDDPTVYVDAAGRRRSARRYAGRCLGPRRPPIASWALRALSLSGATVAWRRYGRSRNGFGKR